MNGTAKVGETGGVSAFTWAAALVAVGLVTLGFGASLDHPFLMWDDHTYLHQNPNLHALNAANLWWMLTQNVVAGAHYNWQPFTALTHALDIHFWGFQPRYHRLGNLVLHAISTMAVFAIFKLVLQLARRQGSVGLGDKAINLAALLGMALFAVHPLRVESVVWIAERKDVLCGAFYLLGVMAWLRYQIDGRWGWRATALLCALLAAMAKPMAVSFPVALLVLEHWPLARFRLRPRELGTIVRLMASKADFIAVAALASVMAVLAQDRGEAIRGLDIIDWPTRVLNAANSLVAYVWRWLSPGDLSPLYTYPAHVLEADLPAVVAAVAVVAVLLFAAVRAARGYSAFAAVLGIYVGCLLPVLGLVQVGEQASADRYTYLPMVGFAGMAGYAFAWGITNRAFSPVIRRACGLCAAGIIVMLSAATYGQATIWSSDRMLWTTTIERDGAAASPFAYVNLGNVNARDGRMDEAQALYERALQLRPGLAIAHYNLGWTHLRQGDFANAKDHADRALNTSEDYLDARVLLALALQAAGDSEAARREYLRVLELAPDHAIARQNLAALRATPKH